ncbi:MAG: hypothetical protein Q9200_005631 [Gallowayella weberi]
MPEYASPVSSAPFYYTSSSGLFVEVEGHRHKRCPSSRLYELLTYNDPGPAYTKKGKLKVHQPPKHKDETQHFYEAQTIHYGLKPFKTKTAAKNALLNAFKGHGSGPGPTLTVPEKITKLEEDLAIQYSAKNAVAKKKYEEERALRKVAEEKAKRKRKQDEADLMAEFIEDSNKKAKPNGNKALKKPDGKAGSSTSLDIATLSGVYTIAAPSISNGWDCDGPLMLSLAPSSTRSHLWGSFDFGVFEGKLRSIPTKEGANDTIRFHWRGRETGEGESTYEPENTAKFTFLTNGKVRGKMYWNCCGEFELVGKRTGNHPKSMHLESQVTRWKQDYWELNDANYERERVSRWGRWGGGYGYDKKEPNSDTENEKGSDEESGDGTEDEDDSF